MCDKGREDRTYNVLENNEFFKLTDSSGMKNIYKPDDCESTSKEHSSFKFRPDWICSDYNCQNLNFARRTHCNMCRKKREDNVELDYTSQNQPEKGLLNNKRNKVMLKPGEWFCPMCNILNFSVRTICCKCFTEKPSPNHNTKSEEKSNNTKKGKDRHKSIEDHGNFRTNRNKETINNKARHNGNKETIMDSNRENARNELENRDRSSRIDDYTFNKNPREDSQIEQQYDISSNYYQQIQSNCQTQKFNDHYNQNYQSHSQGEKINSNSFNQSYQSNQQLNANGVENIMSLALSLGNLSRNNNNINNINFNQSQNVSCLDSNQGNSVQLQSLVQSFLFIMSQKMDQIAFCEFSTTFINLINHFISKGSVKN